MPRPKKPAGSTVDKRNGQQDVVTAPSTISIEKFPAPEGLQQETYEVWDGFWRDRQSWLMTESGKPVLLRWIRAYDRYARFIAQGDANPIVPGSTGQEIVNPVYKIAQEARSTMEACERQLGIGSLNAAALGIAAVQEKKSLIDLSRSLEIDNGEEEDDEDPRLM